MSGPAPIPGGKPPDPASKPSAVGKFAGKGVSIAGSVMKTVTMPVWVLFVPTLKLLQMEMMNVHSDTAVLDVFKHRGASEGSAKKRAQSAESAMYAVGKDYIKGQKFGREESIVNTTRDVMGLSHRCGVGDKGRIANIHYWILVCERDVDESKLSPEARLGLNIMKSLIKEAANEFHHKNLNILGNTIKESWGTPPSNAEIAAELLTCLRENERHHHAPAKLGYDFEALKEADHAHEFEAGYDTEGQFDSNIIKNFYMAPIKDGGLGIKDKRDAMKLHQDDWIKGNGPYDPAFWDGRPGRTLGDLMRHVDVEALKDLVDFHGGDGSDIYDLRFPVTQPKGPAVPRAYDDHDDLGPPPPPPQEIHHHHHHYGNPPGGYPPVGNPPPLVKPVSINSGMIDDSDNDRTHFDPTLIIDDYEYESDVDDDEKGLDKKELTQANYGIDEHVIVDDELEDEEDVIDKKFDPKNFNEKIEARKNPIEVEEDLIDDFEEEVLVEKKRQLEVREPLKNTEKEKILRRKPAGSPPQKEDLIPGSYGLPAGTTPQIIEFSDPHGKKGQKGQGVLHGTKQDPIQPLSSSHVNIKVERAEVEDVKRRAAPKRSGKIVQPEQKDLKSSASGVITVEFFNTGLENLLDRFDLSPQDIRLLREGGHIDALKKELSARNDLTDADIIDAVQAKLAEVKDNLSPQEFVGHYYGMAPASDAFSLQKLTVETLLSQIIPGANHLGSSLAQELVQMGFDKRQGKLNEGKEAILTTLLEKNGQTMEAFQNESDPQKIIALFKPEDVPALMALATDREVVVLDSNNINAVDGNYQAATYAVDGQNVSVKDHFASHDRLQESGINRIVLLKDDSNGTYQVLRPAVDGD